MKDAVELEISGIKCDHCNWKDDDVQFKDYQSFLNKPCPACGHNLLTQKDYDGCVRGMKIVKAFNKINNVAKWFNPMTYWRLIFGDKRKMKQVNIK